jgi:hypothetical protein
MSYRGTLKPLTIASHNISSIQLNAIAHECAAILLLRPFPSPCEPLSLMIDSAASLTLLLPLLDPPFLLPRGLLFDLTSRRALAKYAFRLPTMAFSTMASPPIGSLRVRRRCPLSLLRSSVRGLPATINCSNSMEINCSNSMETWMANQQSTVFR